MLGGFSWGLFPRILLFLGYIILPSGFLGPHRGFFFGAPPFLVFVGETPHFTFGGGRVSPPWGVFRGKYLGGIFFTVTPLFFGETFLRLGGVTTSWEIGPLFPYTHAAGVEPLSLIKCLSSTPFVNLQEVCCGGTLLLSSSVVSILEVAVWKHLFVE